MADKHSTQGARCPNAGSRDRRFDLVLSQNSFEHLTEPELALDAMSTALRPGGRLLITFGPPWYAPHGSHCRFFTQVPWVHLLFSEETVLSVRSRFRADGARRYEEVSAGLNRMSVGRFEDLLRAKGLWVGYRRYRAGKGLDLLGDLPLLRELFLNHVTVVAARTWTEAARIADLVPSSAELAVERLELQLDRPTRPQAPLELPAPFADAGVSWADAAEERSEEAEAR